MVDTRFVRCLPFTALIRETVCFNSVLISAPLGPGNTGCLICCFAAEVSHQALPTG